MIDIEWTIICAGLVFMMQAGFMCLESGLTRAKNSINVAAKNLGDFGVSFFLFWLFGYGVMFGSSWLGVLGRDQFAMPFEPADMAAFFVFQAMFCSTAATIISGATAERLRFGVYVMITMLCSGLIYPIYGHWAWNGLASGTAHGWLGQLGFVDFAGSTVVHSVGGWISLAALMVIGARTGRFKPQQAVNSSGSNLPFSVFGTLLLYFGWLGFNGGSTMVLDETVPRIVGNTLLAGSTGLITAGLISWQSYRVPRVEALINGTLAGLVAITANCHAVPPILAAVIGSVGGAIALLVAYGLERWRIDDAVDAIPIHLGAGAWGTIAVGLFGDPAILETGLGHWQQVGVQCLGVAVAGLWCFGVTYPVLFLLNRVVPLRVTPQEEKLGLNISEHQAKTEIYDLLQGMTTQADSQDLSLRLPVEEFTEAGYIAERYNRVMDSLEHHAQELAHLNANLEQTVAERTAELAQANQDLQELDRVKDQVVANTSTELRTPLTQIMTIAQSLLEGTYGHLAKPTRTNLALVLQHAEHLETLVNDLLDFAQLQHQTVTLQLQAIEVGTISEQVLKLCQPLVGSKPLKLLSQIEPELPLVWIDPDRLQQMLYHLMSNAIKFTEVGSITLRAYPEANEVAIAIADTGIGIPPDKLDRIFESFEQANAAIARNYGGTGLGLSLVKQLVEHQGGSITVESNLGIGSTFTLRLPIYIDQADDTLTIPAGNLPTLQAVADTEILQILLIGDIAPPPQETTYHLSIATDVPAVQHWLAQGTLPNLIVLNGRLAGLSGYGLYHQLRQSQSAQDLPLILVLSPTAAEPLYTSFGADDTVTDRALSERLAQIKQQLQGHQLEQIYRRFVPREFLALLQQEQVQQRGASPDTEPQEMSVLFMELHNLTVLLKQLAPAEFLRQLNAEFSEFEALLLQQNGVIDQYLDDAIIALFGRNPDDAIKAAIALLHKLAALSTAADSFLQMGVGISLGNVQLGSHLGDQQTFERTHTGVNMASHLAGLTRAYGTPLLISGRTYQELLTPEAYHCRWLGQTQVKNASDAIDFYEVYDGDAELLRSQKQQMQAAFEQAVRAYLAQDYTGALNQFQACLEQAPGDTVSQMYLERCQNLLAIET
ncbi:MAG: ammonium transporter [Spirulina sp. SIO3F2]|nr:ammonium transporter [Spirulina sp. SIO3F2]